MFKALVFCGGGAKCISTLGMLGKLEAEGYLKDVETVSACSAGVYIMTLYMLGVKPMDILKVVPNDLKLGWDVEHLLRTPERKGIFRIKRFTKEWRRLVEEKAGEKNITLQRFHEITGKTIYISMTDVDDKCQLYVSHKTHPDLLLFDAAHASSSIPLIFVPVKIDGRKCVDGGLVTNLPIEPVKDLFACVLDCRYDEERSRNDIMSYMAHVFKTPAHIKKQEDLANLHGQLITTHSAFDILDVNKGYDANLEEFLRGWRQFEEYEETLLELKGWTDDWNL